MKQKRPKWALSACPRKGPKDQNGHLVPVPEKPPEKPPESLLKREGFCDKLVFAKQKGECKWKLQEKYRRLFIKMK